MVTSPDAVCEFSVEQAPSAGPRAEAFRIRVDLVGDPSTGCSGRYDFRLRNGRLEAA